MSNDETNRMIEDHINYSIERVKKDFKSLDMEPTVEYLESWSKERLIKRATELSETGIPTLESVKAVIKEREDEYEKLMKKVKRKARSPALSYIAIWAVITFLLALAINLPLWGAYTSQLGKNYWETLFSDGLWTFLVGGIGAILILYLIEEGF